jgi:hypothetical protein
MSETFKLAENINITEETENFNQTPRGNESLRSSNVNSIRPSRLWETKKVSIDRRILNKLMNFLQLIVSSSEILNPCKTSLSMIAEYIQTEISVNKDKDSNLVNFHEETNNTTTNEQIRELKETIENLSKENEQLKKNIQTCDNSQSEKEQEINKITSLLAEIKQNNIILQTELDSLKIEFSNKEDKIRELEENLKNKSKMLHKLNYYKRDSSSSNNSERVYSEEKRESTEASRNFELIFTDRKLIEHVSLFTQPKDFFNLFFSNKTIMTTVKEYPKLIIYQYKRAIVQKNRDLKKMKDYDFAKDYEIIDVEMEKLVREYLQEGRQPGNELKSLLQKAVGFIDKDVKLPLGINPSNTTLQQEGKKSLIGALKTNILGKFIKKKNESDTNLISQKRRNTYENINEFDKHLLSVNNFFKEIGNEGSSF